MIKKWSEFNEAKVYGSKIQSKIDLLKDLSLDLSDMGLKIDIWNGAWRDNGSGFGLTSENGTPEEAKAEYEMPSKSIIMMIDDIDSVLDNDNYYENELKDKKEILDFEETLKSYGMRPRRKAGFSDKVYLFFDKQGKMTDSDLLK
jgi:hypothetical protein